MSLIFSSTLKMDWVTDGLTIRIVVFMCTNSVLKIISKHQLLVNKYMIIKGFPDEVFGKHLGEKRFKGAFILVANEVHFCRMSMPTTSTCCRLSPSTWVSIFYKFLHVVFPHNFHKRVLYI